MTLAHDYPEWKGNDDTHTVKVPALRPWEPMPACAKCGLQLGFGVPVVRSIIALWHGRVQSYAYCRGDHDSTVKMQLSLTGVAVEMPVECFGLFHEHIHLACNRCGYRWLMDCRPPSKPDSFKSDFIAFAKWFFISLGAGTLLYLLVASLLSLF